jgi:hypothetical protein
MGIQFYDAEVAKDRSTINLHQIVVRRPSVGSVGHGCTGMALWYAPISIRWAADTVGPVSRYADRL